MIRETVCIKRCPVPWLFSLSHAASSWKFGMRDARTRYPATKTKDDAARGRASWYDLTAFNNNNNNNNILFMVPTSL